MLPCFCRSSRSRSVRGTGSTQQTIFLPNSRHAGLLGKCFWKTTVAAYQVKRLTAGSKHHSMRAVFSATVNASKQLDVVIMIVTIRVGHSVQPRLVSINDRIEAAVGTE